MGYTQKREEFFLGIHQNKPEKVTKIRKFQKNEGIPGWVFLLKSA
jgi:hypothetical protein